jgi:uncharacterized protein (DUF433 family)
LRQSKNTADGYEVAPTRLPTIRRALEALRRVDLDLWSEEHGPSLLVDHGGSLYLKREGIISMLPDQEGRAQLVEQELLDLMEPYERVEGQQGPHLRQPRPRLRIIPGKLAGSPHVANTRIETIALGALAARGMSAELIGELYPALTAAAIQEALDLEGQLARNLAAA